MTLGGEPPGMVCDAPLNDADASAGVEVEQVRTLAVLRELVDVQARSYVGLGLPENVTTKLLPTSERMLAPHRIWLLARHEGQPVAAAMVLFSHSIAGLYWVATLPERRGRGLGEACTRAATNAAFALGARAVVLQASPQGAPSTHGSAIASSRATRGISSRARERDSA